jgi:hypothetical protein
MLPIPSIKKARHIACASPFPHVRCAALDRSINEVHMLIKDTDKSKRSVAREEFL